MGKFYCVSITLCDFHTLQFVLWPIILKSPTHLWTYRSMYSAR